MRHLLRTSFPRPTVGRLRGRRAGAAALSFYGRRVGFGPRAALLCAAVGLLASSALAGAPGYEGSVDLGAASDDGPHTPDEVWLEGRLLAPCCWTQTLDVHASPLASELRREIRARLRAGEAPASVEDRLADRFGERVRAVPKGRDPRGAVVFFVGAALALALAGAVRALGRWRRVGRLAAAGAVGVAAPPPDDARYEARLDDELRALDDG